MIISPACQKISCTVYPAADVPIFTSVIGETGRSLRSRFGEHLRGIRNNTPGFPVARHFNSTGHSIADVQVQGMPLCTGNNIQRKQVEMKLIVCLGTVQPNGININFSYMHAHALSPFLVSNSVYY